MNDKIQLPEPYEKNIRQAVKILRAAGCNLSLCRRDN